MRLTLSPRSAARRKTWAAILTGCTLLFSACGGSATVSTSPSPASPSAAPSSAAASAKPSAATSAPASASVAASGSGSAASASAASSASSSTSAAASGSSSAATGTPIKVGVLDDVTGPGAIEGAEMHINVDLAVNEVNAAGGINGHPIQTVFYDPKGDPAEAINFATQAAQQDKVDVLTGAVYSAECLAVQKLTPQFGIVYQPLEACANDDLTAKNCNKFTFRTFPVGGQLAKATTAQFVKQYGKNWAILVPQNAFGDSQVAATKAALAAAGGNAALVIQVPVGEANVTPYITKIPTDGSINGLFNDENGADLAHVVAVIQQFGIDKKVPQVLALGRENFGGTYPDAVNGAIITSVHPSEPLPGNTADADYFKAFRAQVAKESQLAGVLGGPDKAVAGNNGYESYTSMKFLAQGMIKAGFTGRADTDKLISAMANLTVPQGPNAPAGQIVMNPNDHQGKMPIYLLKINGQKEDLVSQIPVDQVPDIGTCKIS